MDVISTLNGAITTAKRLKEVSDNIANSEFKNLLADMNLQLADVKLELADYKDEVISLREKLKAFEEKSNFSLHDGKYYKEGDDAPYCAPCLEGEGKAIHIQTLTSHIMGIESKRQVCPICKHEYGFIE